MAKNPTKPSRVPQQSPRAQTNDMTGIARLAVRPSEAALTARPEGTGPSRRHAEAARGRALLDAGFVDRAQPIFRALAESHPRFAAGPVGLAQVAMRRGVWSEALRRWDAVLARFPDEPGRPFWEASRASVLLELGQTGASEAALRAIVGSHPELFNPLWSLLHLLFRKGRHAQALELLDGSQFRDRTMPALFEMRCRILIGLRRLAEARSVFTRALDEAGDLTALERLFAIAPSLYEGWPRTERWLALRKRLQALPSPEGPEAAARIEILQARLHLALRDYHGFLAAVGRVEPRYSGRDGAILRAVAEAIREPAPADCPELKIFGIGLSKTGTTSLAAALTALGWPTLDWRNPLTFTLMSDDDLHLFGAFTDTPACLAFEKYYHQFPNSKFIYTTRPLAAWRASIEQHWKGQFGLSGFAAIKEAASQPDTIHYGTAFRDLNRTLYFNHADFIEAYREHDRRVRRFFADKPKERFLEFNVFHGDGWDELCRFVGCEIPAAEFPWENRTLPGEDER